MDDVENTQTWPWWVLGIVLVAVVLYALWPYIMSVKALIELTQMVHALPPPNLPKQKPPAPAPEPDEPESAIQSGHCYVGTWKGVRSCVQVNSNECQSKKMFPTHEVCLDPKLRP